MLDTKGRQEFDQLKMFHGDFAAAFYLAMMDDDQHVVVSITAHRGDPLVRSTMEFEVLFVEGDTVWQLWGSNVYDLAAFHVKLRPTAGAVVFGVIVCRR